MHRSTRPSPPSPTSDEREGQPGLPDADLASDDAVIEPVDDTDEADEADEPDEDDDEKSGDDPLVREGDVAGDYLERLLDILDVDGDIDLDVEGDRASVAIVGGRLDDLIGPGGATLEALQELTRLAVAQSTGVRSRLMLDVGEFRAKRKADLTTLAGETARRVGLERSARAAGAHEPVRAQGRPRRHRLRHRRAQRVGGRGAEPSSRGPARQVTRASRAHRRRTRGQSPPVPRAAARGGLRAAARRWPSDYVARLASDGVTRGLIGPREVPRLWQRHILNSAAVAEAIPEGARVVDVGSGAGLPGIPLGLARPDLALTLVEPMARRVEFLEEVVAELAVPAGLRWRVVRGRAEERSVATAVGPVDVVTARAVAPLPRLVGWCRGLMRPGTQLVALVGASALAELPSLVPELEAAGMRDIHPRAVGAGLGDAATTVVVMTRGAR